MREKVRCVMLTVLLTLTGSAAAEVTLLVLGVAQDAGVPQAGNFDHAAWADPALRQRASSVAVIDATSGQRWLFDATPHFTEQLHALSRATPQLAGRPLNGIFLTHAHIGHYLGLAFLGHEAMGAQSIPVYAMPRMRTFLRENGPWSQLVEYGNIDLRRLEEDQPVNLNSRVVVTPLRVPHREEFSEVVGFRIDGPQRSALYLPDIDKWERWDDWGVRVEDVLASVDVALIDGTFNADGELPGRDMSAIPHPFIVESMDRFATLPESEKAKVVFIHLNHSNPALDPTSAAAQAITDAGFKVAREGDRHSL